MCEIEQYKPFLDKLVYEFEKNTFRVLDHESDFDNHSNPIGIINASETILFVVELELSDDEFKYKEYTSKNLRVYPLKQFETVYIKAERYFSILSTDLLKYIKVDLTEDPKETVLSNKITKTISSEEVFESFLYDTIRSPIKALFHGLTGAYTIELISGEKKDTSLLKMKYDDPILTSINEIHEGSITEKNLFFNSKLIRGLYSTDVCYWILNECFKHTFTDSIYEGFGKTLNITNMPHIFDFVMYSSNLWITYFKKAYCILDYDLKINLSEIFIANNEKRYTIIKDPIQNRNKFICKILLNDVKDFIGGSTILNSTINPLNQGEMLIYNTNHTISYEDITFGAAYYMVFFLEIDFNI